MDVVVLAAGYATRLHPLTLTRPKALLEVAGTPMIERVMDNLRPIAGISRIVVVTNDRFAELMEQWAAAYRMRHPNCTLMIVNDRSTDDATRLGAIGDLCLVIEQCSIDDDLIVVASDNLFSQSLRGFGEFCLQQNAPVVALYDVGNIEEMIKYNAITVDQTGRITFFEEKPRYPQSTRTAIALYYYPRHVLPLIRKYLADRNNPDQPGRLVQWLYQRLPFYTWELPGIWFDVGSAQTLDEANRIFNELGQRLHGWRNESGGMTSTNGMTAGDHSQRKPRFFISYCVDDKKFVYDTCNILAPYFGRENMFLFEEHLGPEDFLKHIVHKVSVSDGIVIFAGRRYGVYQEIEITKAVEEDKAFWIVGVGGQESVDAFPPFIKAHAGAHPILPDKYSQDAHQIPPATAKCAMDLMVWIGEWWRNRFAAPWQVWDDRRLLNGLPSIPQLFDYEKTIIDFYSAKQLSEKQIHSVEHQEGGAEQGRVSELRKRWPDEKIKRMLEGGVPAQWPQVYRYETNRDNQLNPAKVGDVRDGTDELAARVRAAALMGLDPLGANHTFPEAGPRQLLAFPKNEHERQLNVAILVAGGIAPGINAVIDAIVQRHHAYGTADRRLYELKIYGIKNGFLAIGDNAALSKHLVELHPRAELFGQHAIPRQGTIEYATRGGSMLGTSRDDKLLPLEERCGRLAQIAKALSAEDRVFDILYVISGDGGMKAAHALWHLANRNRPKNRPLSVVTVPKTMDNDILWVWQSFGFLSAVDESRKIVETLHTEVRSNPRLGIVQLFGSDSGFVVSHAVLASAAGHATLALIPEIGFSTLGVARYLKRALWQSAGPHEGQTAPIDPKFPHGLVVMAENAVPVDAPECLGLKDPPQELESFYHELRRQLADAETEFSLTGKEKREILRFCDRRNEGKPFEGQTSDTIRKLGMRIMAETIPFFLRQRGLLPRETTFGWNEPDWTKLRVVCSEPRHLVRALEPSTSDIITGQRLGLLAVDAAMAGYTDCMVSQWLTEFTIVPLDLVVLGRKRIPAQGMFWKSVTSKTGQIPDLVSPYPCAKTRT